MINPENIRTTNKIIMSIINGKRGLDFEKEQEGVYGKVEEGKGKVI